MAAASAILARGAAGLAMFAGVAGCSPTGPGGDKVATETAPLFARFVAEQGEDFEQCFAGRPVMTDPGAIQPGPGAATPAFGPPTGIVIAIDASGSMAGSVGGETKMAAARRAATSFLSGIGPETKVGLIAFGHRGSNRPEDKGPSCAAVEPVYRLGTANAGEIAGALGRVKATGWTPLAAAIAASGREFPAGETAARQIVYVVSDGLETCGGDPVAAARALNAGPTKAIVNIIGFDIGEADRAQLRAVAQAGGGAFVEARSSTALSDALAALYRRAASVSAITTERLDGGARSAANNMAAGRYTAKMNMCIGRDQTDEIRALPQFLDRTGAIPTDREAARLALAARHEGYRTRAQTVSDEVVRAASGANGAIDGQRQASEKRLGVDR